MSIETPLVEYKNFRAAFGSKENPKEVVHGISFSIFENEICALVGESGSGKTVSAQALLRLQSEDWIHYGGELFFEGKNVLKMTESELRSLRGNDLGMIFQEPMTSLNPLHRIEAQLAETLTLHQGISAKNARPYVLDALGKVGLRDAEKRLGAWPHELSGGERQRVMIAMSLLNKPKLLIADEPTTALDVTIQAEILSLLKSIQAETGMAVLFITHDLEIVKKIASKVLVMKDGNIVEEAGTAELFAKPAQEYTRALLGGDLEAKYLTRAYDFQFPKFGEEKKYDDENPKPETRNPKPPPVASVTDLKVYFPIKKGFLRRVSSYIKAVDGVDFTLHRGETLALIGESGSGKTTLGKALLRLEKSTGSIKIADGSGELVEIQNLGEDALRPLRRKMQIIFQDPYGSLSPRMNVRGIVGEGLSIHKIGDKSEWPDRIMAALKDVGMDDPSFQGRFPNEFSGGQRQRIALARSLVLEPEILVLDEPTSSLDRTIQFQVVKLLRKLQETHSLSYIFISHDLRIVKSLCDSVLIMQAGKVVECGSAKEIFESPKNAYTQKLLSTAFG
jgi:microcin C transport system ATP-binding protein